LQKDIRYAKSIKIFKKHLKSNIIQSYDWCFMFFLEHNLSNLCILWCLCVCLFKFV
jgi:hypothetical protein